MRKKQKTVQVGSREYFDALLTYYSNRSTAIVRGRGNLPREDLEYLVQATAKLKDKRLQEGIAELIGWGDEERSELETLLAIGFEAMKLCSPSRLREAAMRVSLKYYMKKEFSHAQESIERQEPRDDRVDEPQDHGGRGGQGSSDPAASRVGGVPGSDNQAV
jgi:hypothetical protein